MMSTLISTDTRDQVGESPLWSVAEQALYWVDIEGRWVRRYDWASRETRSWRTPERIGCIVLRRSGGLAGAMESGLYALQLPVDRDEIGASLLHAVRFPRDGMRFNDGRCDRQGRWWVTSMVRDMSLASNAGGLYCVAGDEALDAPVLEGLVVGNGLAFSPDGSTMYLSDSHPSVQKIWRFDLDRQGRATNRQEFVDMSKYPGRPDGAAVDAQGAYWICANDAGLVHRFLPDGQLERSLPVPVPKPTMAAFGGPNMDRLFVASISPAVPVEGYDASLAGGLFMLQPGVRGLPEVPFDR